MVQPAPAVRQAMRIVELVRDHPHSEFTLSEMARALDMNKSSCLAVLAALEEFGLVVRDRRTLRYSIGPMNIGLGHAAARRYEFVATARIELDHLCQGTGLYWNVGTIAGGEIVLLATSTPDPPTFGFEPGQRISLAPPFGLVYVAWSPDPFAEEWLNHGFAPADSMRREAYKAAIEVARVRGFTVGLNSDAQGRLIQSLADLAQASENPEAVEATQSVLGELQFDEWLLGEIDAEAKYPLRFISAPILNRELGLLGAITIGGFPREHSGFEIQAIGAKLMSCARRIASAHTSSKAIS